MADPTAPLPRAYFRPRPLDNLTLVDELDSLCPIIDSKVMNMLPNSDTPQIFAACGRGARSTFRTLRHGLEVEEVLGRRTERTVDHDTGENAVDRGVRGGADDLAARAVLFALAPLFKVAANSLREGASEVTDDTDVDGNVVFLRGANSRSESRRAPTDQIMRTW